MALTILCANLRRNVTHVQLFHNMIRCNTMCFFYAEVPIYTFFWEWKINTGWWICLHCYKWKDYFKMNGWACVHRMKTFTTCLSPFNFYEIHLHPFSCRGEDSVTIACEGTLAIWTHCWSTTKSFWRIIWVESSAHTVRSSNFPLKVLMWINLR